MTNEEVLQLLETIKFCDVDEVKKIKALDTAISALRQQEQESNEPLTLDELRNMDGEPVWLVNQNGGHWVIMSGAYLWDNRKNAEYGKTWMAYRQKPEEGTNE